MKRLVRSAVHAAVLLSLAALPVFAAPPTPFDPAGNEDDLVPTGKGWGERSSQPAPRVDLPPQANGNAGGNAGGQGNAGAANNGIFYHGGPVMLGTVNAYYIWYGNWSGNSATSILTNLIQNIGGSQYYNINTTYYDGSNRHVSNAVNYAGSTTVGYTHGTALNDAAIQTIVSEAISGGMPKDANAVYFVLTSADVNETSGFCTQYCGWHTHGTIGGSDIKYAFIGNPDRCPSSCAAQSPGPNGNTGADGMASIIAHELEESTSDPDLNAWYDRRGMENADKCAWTFGTTSGPTGAKYNMTLGTRNYLIQQNWVNASGGYCSVKYP